MYKLSQDFIDFVNNNPKLVTRRESTRYPGLYVLKYSRKVFYDALWNDILEECRGAVVDADWNVVVRPFKKIYNRGENGTDIPLNTKVDMVIKVNGFMAAATYVEGRGVVVSTTGSLDSPFVDMANYFLHPSIVPWIEKNGQGITWLFEICHPNDPHIIPELPGAYLIGARFVGSQEVGFLLSETALDGYALEMGAKRPHHTKLHFQTVVDLVKDVCHEGYVVRSEDTILKIKSPYYLITKFLARMKNEKFENIIDNVDFRKTIDEEYYPLLDNLRDNATAFVALDEQQRLVYIREFLEK